MGGVISLLTVVLGQKIFSRKVGIWGGVIFALYPAAWTFADMVMSESLFTVFMLGGLIYMLELPKGKIQDAVLAGLLLGLATLTRSVLYQFPLFLSVIYLVVSTQALEASALVGGLCPDFLDGNDALAGRNQRVFGKPLMTTKSGVDLYWYNHNPFVYIVYNDKEDIMLSGQVKPWTFSEVERDFLARDVAVTWIKSHPLLFAFKGIRMQWNLFGVEREYFGGYYRDFGGVNRGGCWHWFFHFLRPGFIHFGSLLHLGIDLQLEKISRTFHSFGLAVA